MIGMYTLNSHFACGMHDVSVTIIGALHVIPGSHCAGRAAETEIPSMLGKSQAHACVVGRGGASLMRPLLLHASSPSQARAHRRVIR